MARRKKPMIDTSTFEELEDLGPSRTDKKKEQRALQITLEALAMELAGLKPKRLAMLELPPEVLLGITTLASTKRGSALARQRRGAASLLRLVDIEAIRKKLDAHR